MQTRTKCGAGNNEGGMEDVTETAEREQQKEQQEQLQLRH